MYKMTIRPLRQANFVERTGATSSFKRRKILATVLKRVVRIPIAIQPQRRSRKPAP